MTDKGRCKAVETVTEDDVGKVEILVKDIGFRTIGRCSYGIDC